MAQLQANADHIVLQKRMCSALYRPADPSNRSNAVEFHWTWLNESRTRRTEMVTNDTTVFGEKRLLAAHGTSCAVM